MKKCSTSLIFRKMYTNTTMRQPLSPQRLTLSRQLGHSIEHMEKRKPLHAVSGHVNYYSQFGNQYEDTPLNINGTLV